MQLIRNARPCRVFLNFRLGNKLCGRSLTSFLCGPPLHRFDLALSRIFQGSSPDLYALTDHVQAALRARWAGFAPPGSCTLVPLPAEVSGAGRNKWGTHTIAVLPTMKQPEWVGWNRELVYHGMWTLLCEIGRWNGGVDSECPTGGERGEGEDGPGEGRSVVGSGIDDYEAGKRGSGKGIWRVLVTGLGTGSGGVDVELCGQQMVLAVKQYLEGVPEKARWEHGTVKRRVEELEETLGEFSRSGI